MLGTRWFRNDTLTCEVCSTTGRPNAALLYWLIALTLLCQLWFFKRAQADCSSGFLQTQFIDLNPDERMGSRGFISSFPAPTEALEAELKKKAISWWGIELYVLRSIEEARAHDQTAQYAFDQGLYLIAPQAALEKLDPEKNGNRAEALLEEVLAQTTKLVWFKNPSRTSKPEDRLLTEVSPEHLKSRFSTQNTRLRERALHLGPHFLMQGWAYPADVYGAFEFQDLRTSQSTYKTLLSRARKLYREGYRFDFSTDETAFLEDLMIAGQTDRSNQKTVGNGFYSYEENRNEALELFRAGKAFTIRTHLNGKSEGGIVVKRSGNLIDFETTFYRDRGGILFSQIAALILFERLEVKGIDRLYIEMISAFSAGLKAKPADIIEGVKFNTELATRPVLEFDFQSEWVPPGL